MGVTYRAWTRRRVQGSAPGIAEGQPRKLAIEAIVVVIKKEGGFVVDQIREWNVWEDLARERISLMMILVEYSPAAAEEDSQPSGG